jgi:hypothetical protein
MRAIALIRTIVLLLLSATAAVGATPAEALAAALADAETRGPALVSRTRYFWLPITHPGDEAALRFWVNSLSREPELVAPRKVATDVWAVVLDDYGWDAAVWERMVEHHPYTHQTCRLWWPGDRYYLAGWYTERRLGEWLDATAYARLSHLTGSRIPLVRGDWWIVQTCRQLSLDNRQTGIGYYDWFGIRKRADLDRLIDLDRAASVRIGRELRAVVVQGTSGVVQHDRIIERLQARTGAAWVTLDTNQSGAVTAQLGPDEFRPLAEEAVVALPNGLWAYWLGDANGKPQPSAPDFLGSNHSPLVRGNDLRIHVGIACVQCHIEAGLRPIDDWARRTLRVPQGLATTSAADLVRLRRQYLSNLESKLRQDRQVYTDALATCCGLTPLGAAKALSEVYYRYQEVRDLASLAVELGCTEAQLREALADYLREHGAWPQDLAALASLTAREPGALPVSATERHYADLQRLLRRVQR